MALEATGTMPPSAKSSGTTGATEQVARLLKALFDSRQMKISPDGLRMWIDALRGLTVEQVSESIRRFSRECTEFPTPAALRQFATLAIDSRCSIAWSAVRKAIRQQGAYRTVEFDDAITNAAIRAMGGWTDLCDTASDQMTWKEKEFIRHYMSICKSGIGESGAMLGIADKSNRSNGLGGPVKAVKLKTGLPLYGVETNLLEVKHEPVEAKKIVMEVAQHIGVDNSTNSVDR